MATWGLFCRRNFRRSIIPLEDDLLLTPVCGGRCGALVIPIITLLGTCALLAFSLWFWLGTGDDLDFWRQVALLTNWGLLLCIILGFEVALIGLVGFSCPRTAIRPYPLICRCARISANVHLWTTVFCLQLVSE
jgi:hypothetical protein